MQLLFFCQMSIDTLSPAQGLFLGRGTSDILLPWCKGNSMSSDWSEPEGFRPIGLAGRGAPFFNVAQSLLPRSKGNKVYGYQGNKIV